MTNETTSGAAELLPCPFCGGEAEEGGFGYYHLGTESRQIRCTNANCVVKPYIVRDQVEERDFDLVEKWNTRTSGPAPTPDPGLREAVEKAMQRLNDSGTGEMGLIDTIHATHRILAAALAPTPSPAPVADEAWKALQHYVAMRVAGSRQYIVMIEGRVTRPSRAGGSE